MAARHEIVAVATRLAVLAIGERATVVAALAVGKQLRLGAADGIARAIATNATFAKDALSASSALDALDTTPVDAGPRREVLSDELLILELELFLRHVSTNLGPLSLFSIDTLLNDERKS
jgi:hypothetical protein